MIIFHRIYCQLVGLTLSRQVCFSENYTLDIILIQKFDDNPGVSARERDCRRRHVAVCGIMRRIHSNVPTAVSGFPHRTGVHRFSQGQIWTCGQHFHNDVMTCTIFLHYLHPLWGESICMDSSHNGPMKRGFNISSVKRPEQAVEQLIELPMFWNGESLVWCTWAYAWHETKCLGEYQRHQASVT